MTGTVARGPAYWEEVGARRGGAAITAEERAAVDAAQAIAPGPRRALDVGAGSGRFTGLLLERGWSVTAADVDPAALRICAERYPAADVLPVGPGDRRLPAADGSVSLLVCIEVVAVAHADWFPAEAARVLVPGGRLVTVAWNSTSLRGAAARVRSRLRDGEPHVHYRTPYRRWRTRLTAAGLQVTGERGLCWSPFARTSDSRLVPAAVALERALGLRRLPAFSPWVLVTAVRRSDGRRTGLRPDGTPR